MFTIIGGDGKEYGPVSVEQIRSWITGGRANLDTKAKAAGTDEWKRLGDFPEFSGASSTPPPPPSAPVVVTDAKAFADDLRARAEPLPVMECIERSFKLWTSNFLPLVGVTALVLIVQIIANMIPILSIFSSLLLNGVFYGGLYYYYLGKIRGEPREVSDAFAGFTKAFVPLMLASLLTVVIIMALLAVFCAPLVITVFQMSLHSGGQLQGFPALSPLAIAGVLVGGLLMIYVSVSWIFIFPLVIDQGLAPLAALRVSHRVVGKQWFRVFGLGLLAGILGILGVIGLGIGVFFTLPITFGALMYAYESLCRPPPRS